MTDDLNLAPEASDEVVQTEVEQTEAPEVAESTQGQDETQPAEVEAEGEPDAEAEEKSKSAERRERRKAAQEQMRQSEAEARKAAEESQAKLDATRKAAAELPEPKLEDFDGNFEKYQASLSAYYSLLGIKTEQARELEAEAKERFNRVESVKQQQQQEAGQNWEAQKAEAVTRYPDFEAVTTNPALLITTPLANAIQESDVAADLAYHLGKNPEICGKIASLSAVDMARAVGRLEAQLSAPKPKTTTTAPDPINPVRGKATATKDPADMTPQEYRVWREAGGKF